MKILVVDDHPLIREALRGVLKGLDRALDLLEAQSCDEGLAALRLHPDVSLTLLDLALPGTSGMAALQRLRDNAPEVPVVVLSATDHPDVIMQALDTGAMGYIPKSYSTPSLLNALRRVLAGGVYLPVDVLGAYRDRAPSAIPLSASTELRDPRTLGLTQRQAQVLGLLVQGKSNKLICRHLNLAEGTVKIHVTAILRALGVTTRTQAVIAAGSLGLKLPVP